MRIRTTAAATTATLLLLGITACASTTSSTPSSSAPAKDPGKKATTAHAPKNDARVSFCSIDDMLQMPSAKVKITNHSSKSSNYMVSIEFLDKSGTRVAEGVVVANNLGAGKSSVQTAQGTEIVKGTITCRVSDVTRYAAP
jgi:hypothetical protein